MRKINTNLYMKYILVIILLVVVSVTTVARQFETTSKTTSTGGNKTLHLYNGSIEIVDGGFEVTFFYNGTYQLTITSEDGEVIYSGVLTVVADQPIFISADVSAEEDEVDELF